MATKKTPAAKKAPARKKPAPVKARQVVKNEPRVTIDKPQPLTELERRVAEEYLVDLNGTRAYLRAKPDVKEITARTEASRILAKPNVQAEIARLKEERSRKVAFTAERVLEEIGRLALFDPASLYEADGTTLKPLNKLDPAVRAAIKSIEVTGTKTSKAGQVAKVTLVDKPVVLRMAAQHYGLLKEHVEITGKDGGPIETRELSDAERAVRLSKLLAAARARKKPE